MKLEKIQTFEGELELLSGMRIGASDTEIRIGGVDNQVIRNPHTDSPYIPGSSLKGKIRSLLEWRSGAVEEGPLSVDTLDNGDSVKAILQLFGAGGKPPTDSQARDLGPTRLSFWDCNLQQDWAKKINERHLLLTEVKTENSINRIAGTALNPRQTERVPAGALFDFRLSMKVFDIDNNKSDLFNTLLAGLKMLELDSLGGSGSRGYGKLQFNSLTLDGVDILPSLHDCNPFSG